MSGFQVTRRVQFRDTDAAGIAHFSVFCNFMEEAEHAFLRSRGLSVFLTDADGPISWPRVSVKCDFASAVRFEEELTIDVTIGRLGEKSVTYVFDMRCGDRAVAKGEITSVCCRLSGDVPPKSIIIPDWIRAKLKKGKLKKGTRLDS